MKKILLLILCFAVLCTLSLGAVIICSAEGAQMGAYVPGDDVAYAEFASEEAYLNGSAPLNEWLDPEGLTNDIVKGFCEGAYVRVYKDLTYKQLARITEYQSFTLDLGGNTFYKTGTGGGSTGCRIVMPEFEDEELLIKNGRFVNYGDNMIYSGINGREGGTIFAKGTIRFLDVELICSENMPVDHRGGRVVFENCSIITEGLTIFANMSSGSTSDLRQIEFINTDVEMKSIPSSTGNVSVRLIDHTVSNPVNTVIKISGGSYKIKSEHSDSLVRVSGSFPLEASISIEVKDCFVDAQDSVFEIIKQVSGLEPGLYVSNCLLQVPPETNVYSGKVEYGGGEGIITVYDADYLYRVGSLGCPTIYTNVTATTVFSLNFLVRARDNGLTRITVGGKTVYSSEVTSYGTCLIDGEEYYVVSVSDIAAQDTAASQSVVIRYVDSEGKECEAELRYSVVLYAVSLFELFEKAPESFNEDAIEAVKDKLAYICSAYEIFGDSAKGTASDKQQLSALAERIGIN